MTYNVFSGTLNLALNTYCMRTRRWYNEHSEVLNWMPYTAKNNILFIDISASPNLWLHVGSLHQD